MNATLLLILLFMVGFLILFVIARTRPELFGIVLSIFITFGVTYFLFSFIKPEIEKMNNPTATAGFWILSISFLLFMYFLTWMFIRRTKKLKEENEKVKRENKYLRKEVQRN